MRLATYSRQGAAPSIGVVVDDEIFDVGAVVSDMRALIAAGSETLERARAIARTASPLALGKVRLHAPILRPPEFLGVGLNYHDHALEVKMPIPEVPTIFNKQTSSVAGPYDDVYHPGISDQFDYEAELGVVIGHAARDMTVAQAEDAIFGYVVVNDLSVRDVQFSSTTFTLGKSFDTHGPFGPWIVTADAIGDANALTIETRVGDEVLQRGNTSNMIINCVEVVRFLSRYMTLAPGTIVTTGTPAGVGMGRRPRRWLAVGETVSVSITGIGEIANRVVARP